MPELFTRKNFKCDRYCGECCKKYLVSLNKKDIKKIKNLGYKEDEFIANDFFDQNHQFLKKQKNGWCIFLEKEKSGKYSCSIHKNRPEICQQYPFFGKNPKPIESCLPQDLYPNVFFSFSKLKK